MSMSDIHISVFPLVCSSFPYLHFSPIYASPLARLLVLRPPRLSFQLAVAFWDLRVFLLYTLFVWPRITLLVPAPPAVVVIFCYSIWTLVYCSAVQRSRREDKRPVFDAIDPISTILDSSDSNERTTPIRLEEKKGTKPIRKLSKLNDSDGDLHHVGRSGMPLRMRICAPLLTCFYLVPAVKIYYRRPTSRERLAAACSPATTTGRPSESLAPNWK